MSCAWITTDTPPFCCSRMRRRHTLCSVLQELFRAHQPDPSRSPFPHLRLLRDGWSVIQPIVFHGWRIFFISRVLSWISLTERAHTILRRRIASDDPTLGWPSLVPCGIHFPCPLSQETRNLHLWRQLRRFRVHRFRRTPLIVARVALTQSPH